VVTKERKRKWRRRREKWIKYREITVTGNYKEGKNKQI
jgi:hypothetical protein